MARARRQARLAVIAIGVFLGAGASLTARGEVKARDAATLAVLLARIPHVARSESGIGAEERALAEALQAYGAAAVPELLSLLRSPDARIGRFVGYVLRDINGLEERDLDALIAARRRGDGWIPPAIAHIGTPRAIQFLVEELRAKAEVDTQLTWALVTAGERAAAPLADLFGAATPTSAQLARAVCRVFEGMGDRAAPAVEPLMAITSRRALPLANRRHAVDALGCIGPAARPAIATLRRLSASEPARFARATDEVLRAVGAPEAAPGLIAELRAHPSEDALRDLAFIGHDARAAGADVLALASNADWQLRAAAVRTLGFIGYDLAAGSLTALLGNGDDWRLVQAAAESLGRLRATTATVALQQVAADHWYPRVRDAAREALRVIGGTGRPEPRVGRRGFAALFFRYGGCCAGAPADEATPALRHSGDELHGGELRALAYEAEIESYGPRGKVVRRIKQEPTAGLRVDDGFVVGADRGEWGGELVWVDGKSRPLMLLHENVEAIHRLGDGVVVVTGLAHLSINEGMLYRVQSGAGGRRAAVPWKRLPGAPQRSGLLDDGSLFVGCTDGAVVVRADGTMRAAARAGGAAVR